MKNKDEAKKIWHNCILYIKSKIPSISFNTWFKPISALSLEDNKLTIQVPSLFFYEYLEEQYISMLSDALKKFIGKEAKLEYKVSKKQRHISSMDNTKKNFIQKNFSQNVHQKNPFIIPGISKEKIYSQLDENKLFDNFIEGECNRLARSAGLAISKNPGKTAFNPLLIYGGSGLGKTHLSQAIGNCIKKNYPEKIILYLSAEKFQTQFVESIRNNTRNDFIHFYQRVDLLIIDDIQEFAGKEKTQNTFFHIFNHLHQSNKQLILTSDKAPSELKGLKERLLSRFKWGLSADLKMPKMETRLAILNKKVGNNKNLIKPEIIKYIAKNIKTNVRELEGALISLFAHKVLKKKEITIETATKVIESLIGITEKEISASKILERVSNFFNISIENIQSKSRKREIVQARQVATYFTKQMTKLSLVSIGYKIGKRDHSTVLHSFKTVKNLIQVDEEFKNKMEKIEILLKKK